MSGAGRKSGYRKGVTDSYINEYPLPIDGKLIMQICNPRGSNQFEVIDEYNNKDLALLPARFRKVIWIKRNDYVIVQAPSDNITTNNDNNDNTNNDNTSTMKVNYLIESILGKDQIKYIKDQNMWPEGFSITSNINDTISMTTGGSGSVFDRMISGSKRKDDLMPEFNSDSDDEEEEVVKVDKYGNTIENNDDNNDNNNDDNDKEENPPKLISEEPTPTTTTTTTEDSIGSDLSSSLHSKLTSSLSPSHLEVIDESGGCGAKFKLVIISENFSGLGLLKRHRLVHSIIAIERESIHALTLITKTAKEWNK